MTAHLSIVGRKNSGKTTLMSALIAELVRRGFTVASVKHTSHHHEFDTEGKDSWQHRKAGSAAAVIIAPGKWSCHTDQPDEGMVRNLHEALFRGKDLVFWEGRGNPEAPKVELVPEGKIPLHEGDPGLLATISEADRDDIAGLADLVVRHFGLTLPPVPPLTD